MSIFVLVAVACMTKIFDWDIWYHMSIGREIITTMSIPEMEFLVYTNADKPAMLHEWGFGVLVYLIHEAAGINGLIIFNGILIASILLILLCIGRRDWAFSVAKVFALGMVFYYLFPSRYLRVELFLYLAIAFELYFLERFYADPRKTWLIAIPIIALVLTQFHPSAIFLLYFLGLYGLFWLWEQRKDRQSLSKYFRWFLVTGIATTVCAIISPYGLSQLIEPLFFAQNNKTLAYIIEFNPAFASASTRSAFIVLTSCAIFSLIVDRQRRLLNLAFALTFAILSFKYWRNLTLYALVLFIPMARSLAILLRSAASGLAMRFGEQRAGVFESAITIISLLLLLTIAGDRISRTGIGFGLGSKLPIQSANIINEIKPPGRIFNSYEFGGYLGWAVEENNQVFVDGRNYRVWRSFSANASIVWAKEGWQKALNQYGVTTIVISPLIPLTEYLLEDPEWTIAHFSESEALFFRKADVPNAPADDQSSAILAWEYLAKKAWQAIQRGNPKFGAYRTLGKALINTGNRQQAIDSFEKALQLDPRNEEIRQRLEQLLAEAT